MVAHPSNCWGAGRFQTQVARVATKSRGAFGVFMIVEGIIKPNYLAASNWSIGSKS